MSIQFNLQKSTETLAFNLQKKNVGTINPCQVTFVHDVSGSFSDEHENGYTQALLNRFVPFANLFDKNKTMESFAFSSRAEQLDDITVKNYENYIRKEVIGCNVYNGGTRYHTAIDLIVDNLKQPKSKGFFGNVFSKKFVEAEKYLHFFLTDGESQSESQDFHTINTLLGKEGNHFIVFLSVAPYKLSFLERNYGDHEYTDYHNFTVAQLKNLDSLSDDDLYEMLLSSQLVKWMNK